MPSQNDMTTPGHSAKDWHTALHTVHVSLSDVEVIKIKLELNRSGNCEC